MLLMEMEFHPGNFQVDMIFVEFIYTWHYMLFSKLACYYAPWPAAKELCPCTLCETVDFSTLISD